MIRDFGMRSVTLKKLVLAVAAVLTVGESVSSALGVLSPTDSIVGLSRTSTTGGNVLAIGGEDSPAFDYFTGDANGPAQGPAQAIDGLSTDKLYLRNTTLSGSEVSATLARGVVVTPSVGATILTSFAIGTGGDSRGRDAATIVIQGSLSANAQAQDFGSGLGDFVTIYSGTSGLDTDPGRSSFGNTVSFTNALPFTSYRVLVTSLEPGQNNGSGLAISEITLNGTVAPLPEPASIGALIIAGGGLLVRRRRQI